MQTANSRQPPTATNRHRHCHRTIPQVVVPKVARERGMDRGKLRALAAMYWQLRRAFRLEGSLNELWRATKGILQGCPLVVVLVNLLTSIWKIEPKAGQILLLHPRQLQHDGREPRPFDGSPDMSQLPGILSEGYTCLIRKGKRAPWPPACPR